MTIPVISRYEIKAELGRGGMATVFLAYDPRFHRNVAIKLISGYLRENPIVRLRFEREAHLIARIEHPAIVPVYDLGEHDDQLYLVMRYMPGGSLADEIKKGKMTLQRAIQVMTLIAPALDAVHAQGIVHRDLKPGNILLDSYGNPAISDFGIAQFTSATTDLTGSAVIGTPAYMSPEQVRAETDLDGRSDIYALGVILFEMLTGRGPFQATTPLNLVLKHLNDPIPSARSLCPDLPPEVDAVLAKALAKERDARYMRATEMAADLQRLTERFTTSDIAPSLSPAPLSAEAPTEALSVSVYPQPLAESVFQSDALASTPPGASAPANLPGALWQQSARPGERPILPIAAVLMVLLMGLCGFLLITGALVGIGLPGLLRSSAPTPLPVGQTLFADDFSDLNSGWPAGQNARGEYGYRQGAYRIWVNIADSIQWVSTQRVYADQSVFVEARPDSDDARGYYGLLCRIQDNQNFYYFVIRNDGKYTIGKYKDGQFRALVLEGWAQGQAILAGGQSNRLRADCIGSVLRFSVNDAVLAQVTDTDFTSGLAGMLAASLDSGGYGVTFDNFLIAEP
ncbi:MAG: serine/threonine-protein kinase [Anaerolineales bacterium]